MVESIAARPSYLQQSTKGKAKRLVKENLVSLDNSPDDKFWLEKKSFNHENQHWTIENDVFDIFSTQRCSPDS